MDEKIKPLGNQGGKYLGGILIVIGCIVLLGQVFDLHLLGYLWPIAVILPGIFLFLVALAVQEDLGQGLAIAGSIITMVGVILFVQAITVFWPSWTYAWALVAPLSAGLGLWLFGTLKDRPESVKSGKDLTRIGLIIFVVAAVFFELVIGINGFGLGGYGLPLLLILLGLFLLVRNIQHNWRKA